MYNAPDIDEEWPFPEGVELTLSEKDTKHGNLADYIEKFGK